MRVVGYVRVSTSKQVESGLSLESQQCKIRAYCELYDLELVDIVIDAGESAKTLQREGIQQVLSQLNTQSVEGVIVVKLDRLTRSIRDLNTLLEGVFKHSSLFSVMEQVDTRTPAGRLVLNILMSVSQWEREETGERTKVAMKVKRDRGEYTGGRAPIGWTSHNGGLIPNQKEQRLIELVRSYRKAGLSYSKVASKLTGQFQTRTGRSSWSKSMVQNIYNAETIEEHENRINQKQSA